MTAGLQYGGAPRPTIEERLTAAKEKQDSYKPNNEVADSLKGKILGSLIGATGTGKSHLIPFVIKHGGSDFSEVGNMSSRAKRENDPAHFRGSQSIVGLLGRIRRRELVNYMVHPSGDVYASDVQSYTTRYVLLPTLTTALPQLEQSGCFNEVIPVGIVVDGATWENERLGGNKDSLPRMIEAAACVAWLRTRLGKIPILENPTGQENLTAQAIVDIMRSPSPSHPFDNLDRIESLLDELSRVAAKHIRRLTEA